jgi:hypothetical protein
VEEEQQGLARAGYAERVVALLSERLGVDYGAGYSAQNLAYMKQFYVAYPKLIGEGEIFHAVRGELAESQQKGYKTVFSGEMKSGERAEDQMVNIFHAVRGKSETWRPGRLHPLRSVNDAPKKS